MRSRLRGKKKKKDRKKAEGIHSKSIPLAKQREFLANYHAMFWMEKEAECHWKGCPITCNLENWIKPIIRQIHYLENPTDIFLRNWRV